MERFDTSWVYFFLFNIRAEKPRDPVTVIEKNKWHSFYMLVYVDTIKNLPFGICAIYFDLKVYDGFHEIRIPS